MHKQALISLTLSMMLMGCPVSPDDVVANGPGAAGSPGAGGPSAGGPGAGGPGAGGPSAGAGGPGAGAGGPGAGGPGAGGPGAGGPGPGGTLLDMEQMAARQSQDEIRSAGNYVTVSGNVTGECSGNIRIDVIESGQGAPPEPGAAGGDESGGPEGPLTTLDLSAVGAFSVLVPSGSTVNFSALCDNNKDNKITAGDDLLSLGASLGSLTEDQTGVTLEFAEVGPGSGSAGGPGAGGPGAGGPGAGGPGMDGAGAGGPGAGGPGMDGAEAGSPATEMPVENAPE